MAEKSPVKTKAAAAPSLAGLIQTKGAARPEGAAQRGAETAPAPIPAASVEAPAPPPEPRTKALTVKLRESDYQRLRRYAFDHSTTHQDVLEDALLAFLGQRGA